MCYSNDYILLYTRIYYPAAVAFNCNILRVLTNLIPTTLASDNQLTIVKYIIIMGILQRNELNCTVD